jgi:hypothetical protein
MTKAPAASKGSKAWLGHVVPGRAPRQNDEAGGRSEDNVASRMG